MSRNTYDDHWLDNMGKAVIGHFGAQVLLPLDRGSFWFSHLIRILESLEKHSGVSSLNLAHQLQRFLPFAQMPHHDWHHEGHKGCTFTSIGGLWDCVFGTRKVGRAPEIMSSHPGGQMAGQEGWKSAQHVGSSSAGPHTGVFSRRFGFRKASSRQLFLGQGAVKHSASN